MGSVETSYASMFYLQSRFSSECIEFSVVGILDELEYSVVAPLPGPHAVCRVGGGLRTSASTAALVKKNWCGVVRLSSETKAARFDKGRSREQGDRQTLTVQSDVAEAES